MNFANFFHPLCTWSLHFSNSKIVGRFSSSYANRAERRKKTLAIMEMTSRIYLITLSRSRLIEFCLLWLSVALGPLWANKPETKLTTDHRRVCRCGLFAFLYIFFLHVKARHLLVHVMINWNLITNLPITLRLTTISSLSYIEAATFNITLYALYIIYIGH